MSLVNQNWTGLHGEPVTGRIPPRLRVMNGVQPDSQQMGMIAHHYKLLTYMMKVSVIPYLVQERTLADGTRIRMVSSYGTDTVYVWAPKEEGEDTEIPHGFVAVSTWNDPKFYAKQFERSEKKTFLDMAVPQAKGGITSYNAVHEYDKDGFLIEPLVRTGGGKIVWDWAPHAGVGVGGTHVFPINPDVTGFVGEMEHLNGFHHGPAHIVSDAKILSASGKVVAVLEPEPNILLDGTDNVEVLCGAAAGDGDGIALQAMRGAVLSVTANIWQFVFWNAKFRRMSLPSASEATYEAATVQGSPTRKVCGFRTPLRAEKTVRSEVHNTLGEKPSQDLSYFSWSPTKPGAAGGGNGTQSWVTGMTREARPMDIVEFDSAWREIYKTGPQMINLNAVLAVGTSQGIEYLNLENKVAYEDDVYWRAGSAGAYYTNPTARDTFGFRQNDLGRIDSNYGREGAPTLRLKGTRNVWPDVNLFEGDVNGKLKGHVHTSTKYKFGRFVFAPVTYLLAIAQDPAVDWGPDNPWYYIEWYQANDIKPTYMIDYAEWATGVAHGYGSEALGTPVPITDTNEERPNTTGSYKFISRYIIDYDHRGKFFAAIRVEVECRGAEWEEDQGFYLGWQKLTKQPTYHAKIFFESDWGGAEVSKLLAEGTCVRKPYEFEASKKVNPYYLPYPLADERPMVFWLPPKILPDERAISQLKNIPVHQGVNPHLVSQDKWINDDPDPKKTIWSKTGVEFSYITADGEEIPTRKMTKGMLYARSFKLSDFPDALWLLSETKCDAPEGGSQPPLGEPRPMWFYMPQLGNDIANKKFRIEMRDGELYMWTDDLPAKDGMVRPSDPYDREVKLYSV